MGKYFTEAPQRRAFPEARYRPFSSFCYPLTDYHDEKIAQAIKDIGNQIVSLEVF